MAALNGSRSLLLGVAPAVLDLDEAGMGLRSPGQGTPPTTTKVVKETEAEAIAFVIGKAVGLETGSASADYIHLYHGNASLLAESLEVIQQASGVILAALQPPTAAQAEMPDAELAKVA